MVLPWTRVNNPPKPGVLWSQTSNGPDLEVTTPKPYLGAIYTPKTEGFRGWKIISLALTHSYTLKNIQQPSHINTYTSASKLHKYTYLHLLQSLFLFSHRRRRGSQTPLPVLFCRRPTYSYTSLTHGRSRNANGRSHPLSGVIIWR